MCFVFLISHSIWGSEKLDHSLPFRVCQGGWKFPLFIFHPLPSDCGEMKAGASCPTLARGRKSLMWPVLFVVRASSYGCQLLCPSFGCLPELAVRGTTALFVSAAAAPSLCKVSFGFGASVYSVMAGMPALTVVCCCTALEGKGERHASVLTADYAVFFSEIVPIIV